MPFTKSFIKFEKYHKNIFQPPNIWCTPLGVTQKVDITLIFISGAGKTLAKLPAASALLSIYVKV